MTPKQKLAECAALQTAFWTSLRELEELIGVDIDASRDLEETTVAELKREGKK
jgi:hypothetical protein